MTSTRDNNSRSLSRRSFLHGVGGVAVGAGAASYFAQRSAAFQAEPGNDGLRFVHLTDIHLMPRRNSDAGLAACLDAVERLDPKPQFIVAGGDQCDNLRANDIASGRQRLKRFKKIWDDHTDLPTYYCLGNHDPVGWRNPDVSRDDPLYGKQLVMDVLGMDRRYYSFTHGGWRVIVLDDVQQTESGFRGEFPQEQLDFVRGELETGAEAPTIVVCHIPPISAEEFLGGKIRAGDDGWSVGYSRVAANPADLVEVLASGNVKCVLSGHIHHVEHIETHGQTFICGGAVSGNWWQGPLRGCPEGFGIIDCQPGGDYQYRYQDFGWKAQA